MSPMSEELDDDEAAGLPRGTKTMLEILARITPLCDWLRAYRPECVRVCITRDDFDFIRRWPKAALALNLIAEDALVRWHDLELYPDHSPATRYVATACADEQTELPA